jgi:hypothetical protein
MKTAVKPQAKAKGARSGLSPGFSPVSRGAAPAGQRQAPASLAPAPSRRGRITPLTPMRVQAAKSMSKLADSLRESHPDLPASQHLMDAARTLRAGQHEASQRHLRAAMFSLTPQSLMRNGMHTDDLHVGARDGMHRVHRHLLLVKDLDDVAAKNEASIRRDSYDDDSGPMPQPPAHSADPNAGYGPGALAQKPTARQPGGDRALNAPNRSSSGGSDPNVADPVGPQPRGSKQFSYGWGDLCNVIALTGDGHGHHIPGTPDVYRHGFIPINGTVLHKDGIRRPGSQAADKTVAAADKKAVVKGASAAALKSADKEMARRAALLGKPGQVSKSHAAIKGELQQRAVVAPDNSAAKTKPPSDPAEKKRLADIWSESYRYSNKSGYTGADYSAASIQRGKDFADELHRLLSTNTPPKSSAPGVQDAHKFLAMVDHDATVQKGELQRQIDLDTADVKRMFQPGKTMDMPAASWTSKESRAGYYSSGKPGQTTVMMHTAPGAKGLSIASIVPSNVAKREQEVVTGGRYSVDKVQVVDGITHVYVTQQAFNAH